MRQWYHICVNCDCIDEVESEVPELLNGFEPVVKSDGVHGTVSFNWQKNSREGELEKTKQYIQNGYDVEIINVHTSKPRLFSP